MKKLEITWLDHYTSIEEGGLYDYTVKTIGFFSQEDKNYIQLATNMNKAGEPSAPFMNIAKKLIINKKVVK